MDKLSFGQADQLCQGTQKENWGEKKQSFPIYFFQISQILLTLDLLHTLY